MIVSVNVYVDAKSRAALVKFSKTQSSSETLICSHLQSKYVHKSPVVV